MSDRETRYVLNVEPTQQGYEQNPSWKLGTGVLAYGRADLDSRLAHANAALRRGHITAIRVRELAEAEEANARKRRQRTQELMRARERAGRER